MKRLSHKVKTIVVDAQFTEHATKRLISVTVLKTTLEPNVNIDKLNLIKYLL